MLRCAWRQPTACASIFLARNIPAASSAAEFTRNPDPRRRAAEAKRDSPTESRRTAPMLSAATLYEITVPKRSRDDYRQGRRICEVLHRETRPSRPLGILPALHPLPNTAGAGRELQSCKTRGLPVVGTQEQRLTPEGTCQVLARPIRHIVRKGGLEPPRPYGHMLLRHARLPFRHFREAR